MASDVDNLTAARSNLISALAAEEAYELANGARPQYSLFGETYDFPGYRRAALEAISEYTKRINELSAPWEIQSGNVWY